MHIVLFIVGGIFGGHKGNIGNFGGWLMGYCFLFFCVHSLLVPTNDEQTKNLFSGISSWFKGLPRVNRIAWAYAFFPLFVVMLSEVFDIKSLGDLANLTTIVVAAVLPIVMWAFGFKNMSNIQAPIQESTQENEVQSHAQDEVEVENEQLHKEKLDRRRKIGIKLFKVAGLCMGVYVIAGIFIVFVMPYTPWIGLSFSVLLIFVALLLGLFFIFSENSVLSQNMVQLSYVISGWFTVSFLVISLVCSANGDILGIFEALSKDLQEARAFDRWTAALIYTVGVIPLLSISLKETCNLVMSRFFKFES